MRQRQELRPSEPGDVRCYDGTKQVAHDMPIVADFGLLGRLAIDGIEYELEGLLQILLVVI